jgi:hypothetical protein
MYAYQPDITQRSIIAAARKMLEGVQTDLNEIRVPVDRPVSFMSREQAMAGPQDWDKPSYIVTFKRQTAEQEWQPIRVD